MTWKPMPPPGIGQMAKNPGAYMTALCAEHPLSQAKIGAELGFGDRLFRGYLNGDRKSPTQVYPVQYALECFVGADIVRKVRRQFSMTMPRMPK